MIIAELLLLGITVFAVWMAIEQLLWINDIFKED
jgi:hypothetical protein